MVPHRRSPRGTRVVALVAATVALFTALVLTAPAASAHAVVTRSNPADRAQVPMVPEKVSITFSEPVDPGLGGLSVLDRSGARVDNDDTSQPSPEVLEATTKPGLGDGTYVLNYKLVSADGHPITGAIVFRVGTGEIGDVGDLAARNDPTLDVLSRVAQFLLYTGALLAAGLAFFLRALHDGGPERTLLARVIRVGAGVAVVGIVVMALAHTAQATGEGLGAALTPSNLASALGQGLGWQFLTIVVGLALCVASTAATAEGRTAPTATGLAVGGAVLTSLGFILWGHATEAKVPAAALAADAAHVGAAAVWFGGLVGLVTVLRARRRALAAAGAPIGRAATPAAAATTEVADDDELAADDADGTTLVLTRDDSPGDDAGAPAGGPGAGDGADLAATAGVVERFSTAAFFSVLLLFIAGSVLSFSLLESFGDLTGTTWGKLLLGKVAVVAVIAFVAGYNRYALLPWLTGPSSLPEPPSPAEIATGWRTLFNTVRLEAIAVVVVLGLTAVLANTTPSGATASAAPATPSGPFVESKPMPGGTARLSVSPNAVGANGVHVDLFDPAGRPEDLARSVTIAFTLPSAGVGPIERTMIRGATGHFMLEGINDLSIPGTWTIDLTLRVSDFEEETLSFEDTIS